jgi:hypothetical protein
LSQNPTTAHYLHICFITSAKNNCRPVIKKATSLFFVYFFVRLQPDPPFFSLFSPRKVKPH